MIPGNLHHGVLGRAAAAPGLTLVLSGTLANYNAYNAARAAGWDGVTPVVANITVASGAVVYATNTSTPAFDTGAGWPTGSVINLVNNGLIAGAGGAGGSGATSYTTAGYPGAAGGPSLKASAAMKITNYGTIAGGGGGGGGGGAGLAYGGGGGGGRGYNNAPGGSARAGAGGAGNGNVSGAGGNGSASGTYGGSAVYIGNGNGGSPGSKGGAGGGGSGGGWGGAGGNGGAISSWSGGSGGLAGAAVQGNANITWIATGALYGSVS